MILRSQSSSSRLGWRVCDLFVGFVLLFCFGAVVEGVKHDNFKTCKDSGFCVRNRAYAQDVIKAGAEFKSPYTLDSKSVQLKNGVLTGTIIKTVKPEENLENKAAKDGTVKLPLTISFLENGVVRMVVDEERRIKGDIDLRGESKIKKQRYNEAEKWVIVGGLNTDKESGKDSAVKGDDNLTKVVYGPNGRFEALIQHAPFAVDFKRDGETQIRFNEGGLLNVEHWRPRVEVPNEGGEGTKIPDGQENWWDESFGGNTDSKPRGPESVGLDIVFPGYEHVYGIPEHTGPMSLRETTATGGDADKFSEPYRLWNSDVFEYETNSPMTLYGAIPFMQAHKKNSTVGVFWMNAAETWVDIYKEKASSSPLALNSGTKTETAAHFFSESGTLDVFVLLGPTPQEMNKNFGVLTGNTVLPALFSLAYHQCRWNYVTDADVKDVDRKFDKADIPYDVIWLDIEYTDGKKYFTWDPLTFPDPLGMQKQLDEHERKLVAILDPHIKQEEGYPVIDGLRKKDLVVKNNKGEQYEGWCWPGSSYWIDCFNPAGIDEWKRLMKYENFKGSAPNMHIWNDMNEPSVFNGPETSMPRDNIHFGDWEHRDVHNLNGFTFIKANYEGMLERDSKDVKKQKRPFVLTRAYYAGMQRIAAMWTGDNQAEWSHLKDSIPMVLNNGISGFPFAGADVGGFFGNPDKDLLTRWYQAGIFYPFMRAHAHIDTRRREPYLIGEPYTSLIALALRLRYSLLPSWYTAFHEASVNATPIVRPNWWVFPNDPQGFALDDQFYVGSTGLLSKPVTEAGQNHVDIYISDDTPYYNYFDYKIVQGAGKTHRLDAPLETIPLLMRGGHIFPRRDRPRRSSGLMRWDPFTLVIALDASGTAEGSLYFDDGESFAYQEGAFIHRRFRFFDDKLISEDFDAESSATKKSKTAAAYIKSLADVHIEKIIIIGIDNSKKWTKATVSEEGAEKSGKSKEVPVSVSQGKNGRASWAVVKSPRVPIADGWKVALG